ncbi:MAG: GAF domain-containing protein [Acidobacteria bacterium]|nr:GAF domain-containing protein [Acidobacteriaceae bacterium]MBV9610321.1 GAF domain-containing protein [Acidobacteriota bacterium]
MHLSTRQTDVIKEVEEYARVANSTRDLMTKVVGCLNQRMLKYNWVGFYMIEKGAPGHDDVLVLGPFTGAMTPHTRIPLHQGLCGAAAASGKTIVVHDVKSDPRYLACSVETQSEIVVPIFVKGKVVGELDIDSHFPSAFGPDDQQLVERCAAIVGHFLESHPA